jgi:nicotinamidase-related amidase
MALKAHLIVIDPQNDFMDIPNAALPVAGAVADMERLVKLIARVGHKLEDIHVTLDSHRTNDVAHPGFWKDANGKRPNPFTIISHDDIKNGIWEPRNPAFRKRMLNYTAALAANGKFLLMVWPEHCRIGSWGTQVYPPLFEALSDWERQENATVDYVTKGTSIFTEHYGALMAEVPDPEDASTQLNGDFIAVLQEADIIGIAGEASSHCVKATIEQIVTNIGAQHLGKIQILTDCMSPVPQTPGAPDFPAIAQSFLKDMERQGLVLTTSDKFLA